MKKFISLVTAILFTTLSYGQFGVTGGYQTIVSEEWRAALAQNQSLTLDNNRVTQGWAVGVDYWFRLEKVRVEFLPELRASQTKLTLTAVAGNQEETVNLQTDINNYSFNFNTHIYPFDFAGDCDCPVWSKEGPSFSKGFFIRLSPGIGLWQSEETYLGINEKATNLQYSAAVGAGLDIGLSDLLTITPLVEHRWNSSQRLVGLDAESAATNWFAGIRLGVRLDD